MRQEKLYLSYLMMIEADLLRKINIDDIIKDFTWYKSWKKNRRWKCMFSLIYEG